VNAKELTRGPWTVAGEPADGARLTRLRYAGTELLTTEPCGFKPPRRDYGRYERRPVYGYDDCFPTVDVGDGWPDHGELCWLPWQGTITDCVARSRRWPVTFRRRLQFEPATLLWCFAATNEGDDPLPAQHVMHPLFPRREIAALELPPCRSHDAAAVTRELLGQPAGTSVMLHLNDVTEGRCVLRFRRGLRLTIRFDRALFPGLGIWWNHDGYPDEDGCRRNECSLQPTPGRTSALSDGSTMVLPPHGRLDWQVRWEVAR